MMLSILRPGGHASRAAGDCISAAGRYAVGIAASSTAMGIPMFP